MAPSEELEALAKRHGALSYRNRADTQNPAYGFTEGGLNGLIGEVLAKWGTPQPVVREPLSDAQIAEMMRDTWGCASIAPRHALEFARAVERAHGIARKGPPCLVEPAPGATSASPKPLGRALQKVQ